MTITQDLQRRDQLDQELLTLQKRINQGQFSESQKLQAFDKQPGDQFGLAVAISGDWAIVGAKFEDTGGENAGAAYIFQYQNGQWLQIQKLQASDKQAYDVFGCSVAISEDRVIVGAYSEANGGSRAGAAYVFQYRNGQWLETQKLQAFDAQAYDYFGCSVAISGNTLLVGACKEDTGGESTGAAYIFQYQNGQWLQTQKLQASDKQAGAYFGRSVAISGDKAIIGAYPDYPETVQYDGAAYIFQYQNHQWEETAKLQASDLQKRDYFGYSVAISGDTAIVGASKKDTGGSYAGAAYIFQYQNGQWLQTEKLLADDTQAGDSFGYAVAIDGNRVIVGALAEDANGSSAGAAYIFQNQSGQWSQTEKLLAGDAQEYDYFGKSVAISGDRVIVGAPSEDTGGNDAGAAYVHQCSQSLEKVNILATNNNDYNVLWPETQKLQASDKQQDDLFSESIATSGDWAIVGAWSKDTGGANAGAAYIFQYRDEQWIETQKLQALDKEAGDQFGVSVAISGNRAIVGANGESTGGVYGGAAYIFEYQNGQWQQIKKLQAYNNQEGDQFGYSVAISGDWAIVGAHREDSGGTDAGEVYFFQYRDGDWAQTERLQASDKQAGDQFGRSVAISGDWAIVGAYKEDSGGNEAGAAYIFHYQDREWQQTEKLQALDKRTGDQFGLSVAISGNRAIVGANGDDQHAGAAYIFQYQNGQWQQTKKLQASDKQEFYNFGYSVALSGDWVVVGASTDDTGGRQAGAAYIFQYRNGQWQQIKKLLASDKEAADQFGYSVAVSEDWAFVGAKFEKTGGRNVGAAYTFKNVQWQQTKKLQASDKASGDYFSHSVAISGDWAIVGAYREDTGGTDAGAAYIFHYQNGQWSQTKKLQASDKEGGDYFGRSVAINGNRAIVGAYGEDAGGSSAGAAYIFQYQNGQWLQTAKLQAYNAQAGDYFGYSVAIDGDWAIIGAYGEDTGGSSAGEVYFFQYRDGNWAQIERLQASDKQEYDCFGYSVAISGIWAIIGAYREDTDGIDAGAAYIFRYQDREWQQTEKLFASDKQAGDNFGYSVAINGSRAIVGAYREDTGVTDAGAAYIFQYQNGQWSQTQKLSAADKEEKDYFGVSVAINGDWTIVGASYEDTGGNGAGAAYIFHYQDGQWSETQKLQASDKGMYDNFGTSVAINGNRAIVGSYKQSYVGAAYLFQNM